MVASLAIVAIAIVAAAVYIGRTTGNLGSAGASPSSSASASASASGSLAPGGCSNLSFGPSLQPLPGDARKRSYSAPPAMSINTSHKYRVTIETAKGSILLCLDPQLAPKTVNNFVFLARNNFYDGLKFHRVVADFVIQGGDPQGTGSGGPGYQFADEPVKGEYRLGCIAMANSGPNTNGSQFFICIADDTAKLEKKYNLFGYVEVGVELAQKIQQGDVMQHVVVQEQQ